MNDDEDAQESEPLEKNGRLQFSRIAIVDPDIDDTCLALEADDPEKGRGAFDWLGAVERGRDVLPSVDRFGSSAAMVSAFILVEMENTGAETHI